MVRLFINHPKVGTVIVPKSRPKWNSKRFWIMQKFVWALGQYEDIPYAAAKCKNCNKLLMNPHSILLHIGNGCEKEKNEGTSANCN